MLLKINKIAGFTLVELLVALAINLILITALVKIFSENMNNFNRTVNADTLKQQLQVAMLMMESDIRRAGYWGNAISGLHSNVNNNPFMASGTDITTSGSCILFSYDYNQNGSLASISTAADDERYGYRLNAQTLQARPPGAPFACDANATAWDNVTNPNIVQITALSFSIGSIAVPIGATANRLLLRTVNITLSGRLASDTSVTATLTGQVRIRNDKFVP